MPLKNWCSIHAKCSKSCLKHPIPLCGIFSSLKQNLIAYRTSKVSFRPDCIFEIHQLWQSGFSSVYSNSCCSCSFEHEIIKISASSHKMYSNKILNFQESTIILNACTKKVWKLIEGATYVYSFTCAKNVWCKIEFLMSHRKCWNYLTVFKQMSPGKINIIYKRCIYKSYIHTNRVWH